VSKLYINTISHFKAERTRIYCNKAQKIDIKVTIRTKNTNTTTARKELQNKYRRMKQEWDR
jgi:hypothetical protein